MAREVGLRRARRVVPRLVVDGRPHEIAPDAPAVLERRRTQAYLLKRWKNANHPCTERKHMREVAFDDVEAKLNSLELALETDDATALEVLEAAVPTYTFTPNEKG